MSDQQYVHLVVTREYLKGELQPFSWWVDAVYTDVNLAEDRARVLNRRYSARRYDADYKTEAYAGVTTALLDPSNPYDEDNGTAPGAAHPWEWK